MCIAKDKIGGSRGVQWGLQGALRVCTVPTLVGGREGASVHKPQWADVHRAGGGYTMLQKQLCITPDPVNLSHFC